MFTDYEYIVMRSQQALSEKNLWVYRVLAEQSRERRRLRMKRLARMVLRLFGRPGRRAETACACSPCGETMGAERCASPHAGRTEAFDEA